MYTEEITKDVVSTYMANPTRETVNELAEKYDKSIKSIIGKLSKEGIYRREVYLSKTGERPILKADIVADIAAALELEPEDLLGLDKTPKQTLKRLKEEIEQWLG